MPQVELLYFPGCPHVTHAREQLTRALRLAGLPPVWSEHDVSSDDVPARLRGFGSPTILIDGCDVSAVDGERGEGVSCRVYADTDLLGAPPMKSLLDALKARVGG